MKPVLSIHPLLAEGAEASRPARLHSFPAFSFSFLTEGEMRVCVEGKDFHLGPGQFLLVPENQALALRLLKGCRGFTGTFSLSELKDASYPVLRTREPLLQSFWFDDAVFLAALLRHMQVASADKGFLRSGLDLILGQLRPGGKMAAIPEKFLQMVFEEGHATLSVSDYARQLQVTPNYLNKTVKAHTRRTAIDWIELARLNLAKKLLKDPQVPIADVARLSGVEDPSYFSRFFRKKTGLTPSQYRSAGD